MSLGELAMINNASVATRRLPKEITAYAESQLSPVVLEDLEYDVTFELEDNEMLKAYLEADYAAMQLDMGDNFMRYDAKGKKFVEKISLEEFIKYCNTLIISRIAWVTRDKAHQTIKWNDDIASPALLTVALENLGYAENLDIGVYLKPSLGGLSEEWITANTLKFDDCVKISRIIKSCKNYCYGVGFLKTERGSWDYMVMQIENGAIYAPSKQGHPVYALLSALTGNSHKNEGPLTSRVMYGRVETMKRNVTGFTSVEVKLC